ncbi:MAG TPA: hypothetical protein VF131_01795 [Blastocatellia bacterium]|nr:hypothetical protein [Blastocatellia bacterium]
MKNELESQNQQTPQPRPFWKRSWVPIGLGILIMALLLIIIFWPESIAPGKPVFIRDVYIVLDPSGSMLEKRDSKLDPRSSTKTDLEEAKKFVTERILPLLGPGDQVFCYNIGPGFVESDNRVFGEKQIPGAPENLLNPKLADKVPAKDVNAVWQQARDVINGDWATRVNGVSGPVGGKPGSNYIEAFSYIVARLKTHNQRSQKNQRPREQWLIVIGDLIQSPEPNPFRPPEPEPEDGEAFKGIQVRLFYPYRVNKETKIRPDDLKKFWGEYFSKRGAAEFLMAPLDDLTQAISPSPVPDGSGRK